MKRITTIYVDEQHIEEAKKVAKEKHYEDFNTSQLVGWLLRKFIGEN